jgi:hypothetical protein
MAVKCISSLSLVILIERLGFIFEEKNHKHLKYFKSIKKFMLKRNKVVKYYA